MELYIFNDELEFQGIVDAYTSFRWVRRFYKIGECELHVELTPKNLELLKLDNFIVKKDDTEPCVITYRNLKLNEDGTEVIVVKGLFAKSILAKRIIYHTQNFYKAKVNKAFFELLADSILYGGDRRQLINVFMGASEFDETLTETFTKQMSYTNLLESIEEVTRVTGVGTRLDFNVEKKMFYFEMYKPKNRTVAQAAPIKTNLYPRPTEELTTTRFLSIATDVIFKNYIGKAITISLDLKCEIARAIDVSAYQNNGLSIDVKDTYIDRKRLTVNTPNVYQSFTFVTTIKDWGINNATWTKGSIGFYDPVGAQNYSIKNINLEIEVDPPAPNPVAKFSKELDNVLEQEFVECNTDFATTAIIGGEGEGTARVVETTGDQHMGYYRREIFVDARDLQKKDDKDVAMTDAQYTQLLLARGQKALEDCKMVSSFTSKINSNQSNLVYKKDYDLGDTVTCVNEKWGVKIDTQITEIEEIYENNTKEIYVVFGDELPTITDKLRRE